MNKTRSTIITFFTLCLVGFVHGQAQLIPNPTMAYTGSYPNISCFSNWANGNPSSGTSKSADNWLNLKPVAVSGPSSIDNCPSICDCNEVFPGFGLYDCQLYGIPLNPNDVNQRTLRWFRAQPSSTIQECTGTNLLAPLVAGQQYTLMFESWGGSLLGECDDPNSPGGSLRTNSMKVQFYNSTFANQNTIGAPAQSFTVNYSTPEQWQQFIISFTATGNHRSIVFDMGYLPAVAASSTAASQTAGLDNVYLFNGPIPLGVDAINLNVRYLFNQEVDVIWESINEQNCAYYDVERTLNGVEWEFLGSLTGSGNTVGSTFYSFRDNNAYLGTSYYRVKQVDFDGETTYSLIKSMYIENTNDPLFSAMIENEHLVIQIDKQENVEDLLFDLYDWAGRRVLSMAYSELLNNEFKVGIEGLSSGIYYVRAGDYSQKLFKP